MIKSIKFNGKFGYITEKIPEPDCPVRGCDVYPIERFSEDERKEITNWKKRMKEWRKYKNNYRYPQLVKNLLNRDIEFKEGKINIIFGQNASGKTTILKALAGYALTTDGYAVLSGPLDFPSKWDEKLSRKQLNKYIDNKMGNSAVIEWDGAPVYYHNFDNRVSYGCIGDMSGSVLGNDIMTEVLYTMGKKSISLGQNSMYLFNRLMKIAENQTSYSEMFKQYLTEDGSIKSIDDFPCNSSWAEAYTLQLQHLLGFEKSYTKSPSTFLFDEIDKSLDITNVYELYNNVLPSLMKETGIQIIIISHSPLVLSEKIRNNELYNFISIDEEYTNNCIKLL